MPRGGSSGTFGGQVLLEGPNLPQFSSVSTDLGHFLEIAEFCIHFFILC